MQTKMTIATFLKPEIECLSEELGMTLTSTESEELAQMIEKKDESLMLHLKQDPQTFLQYGDEEDWSAINMQLKNLIFWYVNQMERSVIA